MSLRSETDAYELRVCRAYHEGQIRALTEMVDDLMTAIASADTKKINDAYLRTAFRRGDLHI